MKNRLRSLVIALMLLSGSAYSQDLYRLMNDPNANFFYVKKVAEEYFKKKGTGKGSGYKQYKRWEYEMEHKIDPNGNRLDPRLFRNEYQSFQKKFSRSKLAAAGATSNWKELGPKYWNQSSGWNSGVGRITSITVDPNNSNTIYITSPGGGCWKSTNAGSSWIPLTDNEPVMDTYCTAVVPGNSSIIYLGTSGGGVLKSTNGGTSWTAATSGIPSYAKISKMLIHPTNTNTILAATNSGVYRTTNGGTSWTQVSSDYAEDIEFKPGDLSTVYAAGYYFLKSTNGGQSFTQITSGLPTSGRTFISVTPANSSYVYLVQANGSEFGYLYRSTDSGNSFSLRVTGNPANGTNYFGYDPTGYGTGGQAGYDMAMCVSPTNADEVYIGGINVWKSANGGTSFTALTDWAYPNSYGYVHADVHVLEYIGTILYTGSDGGIYSSTNGGDDFTDLSTGLGIRQFYRLGCSATDPVRISGGAQDNGSSVLTGNGWLDWLGGDGMETFIDHTNPNIMYGTTQNGGLNKSLDGGFTRAGISTPSGTGNWVTPWVMDPSNNNTLYLGYNILYKSTDGGNNWTNFPSFPSVAGGMNALAVAPSNSNYIYASQGGTIFRTKNGGSTWTTLNSGGNINQITVHPTNPEKIYLSLSYGARVLVSTNAGDSFTDISGTLPNISANSIVVDNTPSEGLYVALQVGVYYRNNTMSDWIPFMENLPKVVVNELEINYVSGKIRAATYGRGIWESPLYNAPSVSITSPAANSLYVTGTNVTISADASDPDGTITKVEFYDGATKLGEDATSPYEYIISGISAGRHDITAKAIDNNSNTSSSAPFAIYGLRNPENPSTTASGVDYSYYEGDWSNLPDFNSLTAIKTGVSTDFNLSARNRDDLFAFKYVGYINITTDGVYQFYTKSDDGSQLYIGNTMVVNNDGLHGADERTGFIALKAGKHAIKVVYFENGGGEELTVQYTGPGISKQVIPAGVLFRDGSGNAYPTVSITSPVNNATFASPSNITINATANDSDGTISKVEFYNGATKLGEDNSSPYSYSWSSVGTGTYVLTARAYDNLNAATTSSAVNITVNNAPTASITSPSNGATYTSGANITIDASAADADGAVSKVEFYQGTTKLGEDLSSPYSYTWNSVVQGTYSLTVRAIDNLNGVTTSSVVSITVNGPSCTDPEWNSSSQYSGGAKVSYNGRKYTANYWNQNARPDLNCCAAGEEWVDNGPCSSGNITPNVNITDPSNNAAFASGTTITITADATDSDGAVSKVEFYQGATKLGEDNSSPYSYTWNTVATGAYALTAKAIDNQNAEKVSAVVNIVVNNLPAVSITAPLNNATFASGANITIDATASDNDGSISKVEFYRGTTKLGEDNTSPYSYIWNNVTGGTYALTAKAIDNLNGTTTSSVINITVNALPTVNITAPSNNAVYTPGSNITINATASDMDGTVSKVEFYQGSTKLGEDNMSPYSYTWNSVAAGSYALTAKAIDNLNGTTTSSVITIAVTAAPTVSITSPGNGATFTSPANITIDATAADSDGSISKVEFYQGSTKLGEDNTSPYSYTWNSPAAGSYSLTAKAIDNLGAATTSTAVNITVTGGGCSAPQYVENGGYVAGSRVKNNGVEYECKGFPYTSWCNGAAWAYAPGTGTVWGDAWTQIGPCREGQFSMESDAVTVYPNPALNSVNINFTSESSGIVTITVTNELSETVKVEKISVKSGENLVEVHVNELKNGVYMLKIDNNGKVFTKKLSIIK